MAQASVQSPPTAMGSSVSSPDGQTAPCWVEISHDGQFLFTVNTGSGNISSYSISRDGSLVLVSTAIVNGGGTDIDARLSPDGKYLLVDGSGHNFVSVFSVDGGTLTELSTSPTPLPVGATPAGIVNT
jgi:6-phosphogluconolactonase (cycloisomerase 2 family)